MHLPAEPPHPTGAAALASLAAAMGRTPKSLRWLAFPGEPARRNHYRSHSLPKGIDSHRDLLSPHRELALTQEWILRNVVDPVGVNPSAHAYVKGRSVKTFAEPHTGKPVVLMMDLLDFFGHCTYIKVQRFFHQFGFHPAVESAYVGLTVASPREPVQTERGLRWAALEPASLPQGASTSPAISNHCAATLDCRLTIMADRCGYTYTRYSDDMAFSPLGPTPKVEIAMLPPLVSTIVRQCGFKTNPDKTRFLRHSQRQKLCGVIANVKTDIPREDKKAIRDGLNRVRKFAADPKPPALTWPFIDALRGRIAWHMMFQPDLARLEMIDLHDSLSRIDYKDIKGHDK